MRTKVGSETIFKRVSIGKKDVFEGLCLFDLFPVFLMLK